MSDQNQTPYLDHGDTAIQEAKPQLKEPSMYQVVLLNDDYTLLWILWLNFYRCFFITLMKKPQKLCMRYTMLEKASVAFILKMWLQQKLRL